MLPQISLTSLMNGNICFFPGAKTKFPIVRDLPHGELLKLAAREVFDADTLEEKVDVPRHLGLFKILRVRAREDC